MTTDYTPQRIPLDQLDDNPYQPRTSYEPEALRELAAAIAAEGLLQPPIGRRTPDGRVQLAFGHRRRRAFDLLAASDPAWAAMPVVIRALDDPTMARQAWKENRDRRDLTAFEEATAIARYGREFGWSQSRIGVELGLDRSTVSNKLRILKLPPAALALLEQGALSERQAQALVPLAELPEATWAAYAARGLRLIYLNDAWRNDLAAFLEAATALSADRVRKAVDEVIEELTIDLSKQPWAKETWSLPEQRCTTCTDCLLRMSGDRCPDRDCAEAKRVAWLKRRAEAAAAKAKLPPVAIGSYDSYDRLDGVPLAELKAEAARRGCGTLGVAVNPGQAWFSRKVEGHPDCGIVCAHGQGGRCACRNAVSRSADGKTSKAEEAAQLRAEKKRARLQYKEPAERALRAQLALAPTGLLRVLAGRLLGHSAREKLGKDATPSRLVEALSIEMIHEATKRSYEYSFSGADAVAKELAAFLALADIPLPWAGQEAPPAPPAGPDAEALRTRALEHLAAAIEMATIPMADHWLIEAAAIRDRLPAGPTRDALAGEVARAVAQVAAARATARAEEAAGAAITAASLARQDAEEAARHITAGKAGVRAHLPPLDGFEPPAWDEIEAWIEALDARIAAGEAGDPIADALERLADHLEAYTDNDEVSTAAWEAASMRLDDLAGLLAQREAS